MLSVCRRRSAAPLLTSRGEGQQRPHDCQLQRLVCCLPALDDHFYYVCHRVIVIQAAMCTEDVHGACCCALAMQPGMRHELVQAPQRKLHHFLRARQPGRQTGRTRDHVCEKNCCWRTQQRLFHKNHCGKAVGTLGCKPCWVARRHHPPGNKLQESRLQQSNEEGSCCRTCMLLAHASCRGYSTCFSVSSVHPAASTKGKQPVQRPSTTTHVVKGGGARTPCLHSRLALHQTNTPVWSRELRKD